ncbi:hypothetical protein BS47DRAFT_1394700 [Hydnum rufescens UP504]|uniref:Uncharacterized protein n=1 Tax=Hydnum rufescens UP504 TaxID=1448309 RepID=A0A9P6AW13_9AGAM|nr:hypothetical protein BS47DRAFT_1394700 [Hydnum rufescens UP504]
MSTPVSQVSPIPLPSPTIVRDGWTVNSRGVIHIQEGNPLPTPVSRPYEYLAEETISPAIGFPEQSGAVVSFHPKCSFYYLTFFVVIFIPAWATLPQPAGFDALERAYEPADPVIFPPGAKQYIYSVVRPTPPPISSPILLQDPRMVDGWQVTSQGIISHKRQSFPEGNMMRHEQEFITVPHWSLSPEVVGSEAKDESDGAIVSNSMVWVTEADTQAEVCGENRVARNQRKKQKKAQNKKAWEERLEREWRSHASTSIQPDKEALDAWNAPSIYDSVDNSNTLDPLPFKHERASETIRKSILIEPLPSQHWCTSDKGASVEKSSLLEASGSIGGSALDPAPLLPLPAQPPSECPDRGSRICYNHCDVLYDSYVPSHYEVLQSFWTLCYESYRPSEERYQQRSREHGCRLLDRGYEAGPSQAGPSRAGPSYHYPDSPPPRFEPLLASVTDDRLQEGRMIRDEGRAQEKHRREVEEFSPSRKLPLPRPSVNEASDVDSHVSWGAVVGTLNEISQVETESYVTQGTLEEAAALSYMGHSIPPSLRSLPTHGMVRVRMTAVHTHDFPQYLGEVDSQAPLNVYGPHAMNEHNLQRLDFQRGPVAGSLSAPHYAFVVPRPPFSIIPEPESSDLIYNSSSPALCRVNNSWIANRAGPRSTFGRILGIASTMVNHLHALRVTPHAPSDHSFSALDESSKRARSADAELHRLMVFTTFDDVRNMILYMEQTIALSLAVVCMSVLIAIDARRTLDPEHHDRLSFAHFSLGMRDLVGDFIWTGKRYEEGLHPPSGGKRRWYHARMPLPMGNHLPAQQALLGIEVEMLDVSGGLLSTDNERTPKHPPICGTVWWLSHSSTEIALLSMSRTSRDDVYHFLKEDAQFSKVVPVDPVSPFAIPGCPISMFKEPGYVQHLWKYSHPLSVHGPCSHCRLPPVVYRLQSLVMNLLSERERPPKRAYSRAWFSKEFLASLCQAPCPTDLVREEALSLQCLEILLSLLADFNASFLRPIYPARSGPYVKLLCFIASRVEFAAQSNSTQCDVIPQAQQEKLNVLQLTEAIGYKLDTKQFFINWDPSSPTPSFIPSLSTLEAESAQSEERVKNLKTSKAKRKGKMVK